MKSVVFVGKPNIGTEITLNGVHYTAAMIEPYTRVSDGGASELVTWVYDCRGCGQSNIVKTSRTQGLMHYHCLPCHKTHAAAMNKARAAKVDAERQFVNDVHTQDIYDAVGKLPREQLSMARNAARRIYAPLVLRTLHEPLQSYTLEEVREGIEDAIDGGLIAWVTVAYRPCRHPLKGLVQAYIPPAKRAELERGGWLRRPSVLD